VDIKIKLIPVVTGQLEPYQHHYIYLNNISRSFDIKGLQKAAILGTAHMYSDTSANE